MDTGTESRAAASRDAGAVLPRGAQRMFGLKDVFTTVNVLSGVAAIYLCMHGQPLAASYAFLVGYAADCLDANVRYPFLP